MDYRNPFLNLADETSMVKVLSEEFQDFGITETEIAHALRLGFEELDQFKLDVCQQGKNLTDADRNQSARHRTFWQTLSFGSGDQSWDRGSDYQEGFHVLTEDSIAHLGNVGHLRVVNQWVYHSRLYAAARSSLKASSWNWSN